MKTIKVPHQTSLEEIQKLQKHYDETHGKGAFVVIRENFKVETLDNGKDGLLLG